jgi:hypothetical protein
MLPVMLSQPGMHAFKTSGSRIAAHTLSGLAPMARTPVSFIHASPGFSGNLMAAAIGKIGAILSRKPAYPITPLVQQLVGLLMPK